MQVNLESVGSDRPEVTLGEIAQTSHGAGSSQRTENPLPLGMGSVTVGFYHGALTDSYEKQANAQGFTLGEQAKLFEDIAYAYNTLRIEGYLTDKQADAICKKIQKNLVKNLHPLQGGKS